MTNEKMSKKQWLGVIFIFILLIAIGMTFQKLITKPKLKITKLDIAHTYFEEGTEVGFELCWKINVPADEIYMDVFTNPPLLGLDCFESEGTILHVWKVGETICGYHTIKIKENLSTQCFRGHELDLRLYGMGLEDEKIKTFNLISKNSQYCNKCERIC